MRFISLRIMIYFRYDNLEIVSNSNWSESFCEHHPWNTSFYLVKRTTVDLVPRSALKCSRLGGSLPSFPMGLRNYYIQRPIAGKKKKKKQKGRMNMINLTPSLCEQVIWTKYGPGLLHPGKRWRWHHAGWLLCQYCSSGHWCNLHCSFISSDQNCEP